MFAKWSAVPECSVNNAGIVLKIYTPVTHSGGWVPVLHNPKVPLHTRAVIDRARGSAYGVRCATSVRINHQHPADLIGECCIHRCKVLVELGLGVEHKIGMVERKNLQPTYMMSVPSRQPN